MRLLHPSTQPAAFDPIAYHLERLLECVPMPADATPEQIAAQHQAAADAFAALGPRNALEGMLACSALTMRYAAADMLRRAAALDPSDPLGSKMLRLARSMARTADQGLRDLKQRQRQLLPPPLDPAELAAVRAAIATVSPPRPRPKLTLVVNPETVRPKFGNLA